MMSVLTFRAMLFSNIVSFRIRDPGLGKSIFRLWLGGQINAVNGGAVLRIEVW